MQTASPDPASASHWFRLAWAGLTAFVLAATVLHLLRPDLDPVASQMSLYLTGRAGFLLQAAYVALGIATTSLGIGLYRTLPRDARSVGPLLMLAPGAVALAITACALTDLPGAPTTLQGLVHRISAQAAFLCTATGLVLQALRLRLAPAWQRPARWLLPWALACFAAIWVLALWRDLPRGLAQKAVIGLILGWLATVAWLQGRAARAWRDRDPVPPARIDAHAASRRRASRRRLSRNRRPRPAA